jgi:mono/diheme cytochrome c family protein
VKRFLLSLTIIALACIFSFGQSAIDKWTAPARAAAKKNPVPANETSIALGKKIYERQCLACHGTKGKGDGPVATHLEKRPGNLASPKLWEQSDGALFWKVNEGHRPMPTFKNVMSDEERWPVINYIRTLAPKPAASDQPKKESKP